MPGMMDTILNLGLNDQRVKKFATLTSPGFAFDCYRRLIQMFGDVVITFPKNYLTNKRALGTRAQQKLPLFKKKIILP